jgi:hypothetical protein
VNDGLVHWWVAAKAGGDWITSHDGPCLNPPFDLPPPLADTQVDCLTCIYEEAYYNYSANEHLLTRKSRG